MHDYISYKDKLFQLNQHLERISIIILQFSGLKTGALHYLIMFLIGWISENVRLSDFQDTTPSLPYTTSPVTKILETLL